MASCTRIAPLHLPRWCWLLSSCLVFYPSPSPERKCSTEISGVWLAWTPPYKRSHLHLHGETCSFLPQSSSHNHLPCVRDSAFTPWAESFFFSGANRTFWRESNCPVKQRSKTIRSWLRTDHALRRWLLHRNYFSNTDLAQFFFICSRNAPRHKFFLPILLEMFHAAIFLVSSSCFCSIGLWLKWPCAAS